VSLIEPRSVSLTVSTPRYFPRTGVWVLAMNAGCWPARPDVRAGSGTAAGTDLSGRRDRQWRQQSGVHPPVRRRGAAERDRTHERIAR